MRLELLAAVLLCAAGSVAAKLPPLTAEELQAAQARKQKEDAQLEQEKKLLEKAQDRVAQHYRRTKGAMGPGTRGGGQVADHNMPKTTKELPHSSGPQGGKSPSAEAHSAPAR